MLNKLVETSSQYKLLMVIAFVVGPSWDGAQ
jgi:hypothetical protein